MSRSSWNIYYLESGDTWTLDGSIYRPNEVLSLALASTESSVNLVDGSIAHITVETKSNKQSLSLVWMYVTSTLKEKIEAYINAGTDLKITDHNANSYYGRFVDSKSDWLVGTDGDYYDVTATFKQIASLEV